MIFILDLLPRSRIIFVKRRTERTPTAKTDGLKTPGNPFITKERCSGDFLGFPAPCLGGPFHALEQR